MTNNFNIPTEYLTDDEMAKLGEIVNRLDDLNKRDTYQTKFIDFVKHVWPAFIEGKHHKIYAEKLQNVADGKSTRLIVNMPPRHTKSEFASYLFQELMFLR